MHKGKVCLIDASSNPIRSIANAFRTCRRAQAPWTQHFTHEEDKELIRRCLPLGHRIPIEQCSLTFGLSGQSRTFSAQFLRSRLTSPVQQSQRAVSLDTSCVVYPPSGETETFTQAYEDAFLFYDNLIKKGVAKEDARYVLPLGVSSNIQITMNLAEFIHICNERLCYKAQDEYRNAVQGMVSAVIAWNSDIQELFGAYFSPKCHPTARGYCREAGQCSQYKGVVPTFSDFVFWRKHFPETKGSK